MVAAMKAASTSDQALSGQIDELSNLWDRVNQLSELRENRLHGASKLVSIFTWTSYWIYYFIVLHSDFNLR